MRTCRSDAGFTLIELVVALSVVSIALAGLLLLIRQTLLASADPVVAHQSLAIGEAYLEEILSKPFYDPDLGAGGGACPAAEASRAVFDNVCDYAGLSDSPPVDQTGSAVPGMGPYAVAVAVDTAASLGGITGSPSVLRIDVTVTPPAGPVVVLSGYRTSY